LSRRQLRWRPHVVTGQATRPKSLLVSALGAAGAVLCGLVLWLTPLGDVWVNSSYDYLFRFENHAVTNQVTLILMDNAAFAQFHQTRGQPWNRALHARLLNRLADDGCALVVMDSFFRATNNPEKDDALAAAMRRQRRIVLMAEQSKVTHPDLAGAQPVLPAKLFLDAAKTNWGVAWLDPDLDSIVRRQWPFPSPGPYPSLPWTAARLAGAKLNEAPQERWLRYYGQNGNWTRMSYQYALTQPANYFRNQIVFIGTQPKTSLPDGEADKFSTPYTRWTGEASGGVEILVTSFLNLLNNDSLQRPPFGIELFLLTVAGIFLGGGLCRLRRTKIIFAVAAGIFLTVSLAAILLSYYTNYWFPWLIIVGGQAPCALAWTMATGARRAAASAKTGIPETLPETPGYELVSPPFAEGAYGKVWLARSPAGQWVALKVIYLAKFGGDPRPYEREFNGVQKYKPVSGRHPGLLRVEFVSAKKADYFYYVMELGDSLQPGWQREPSTYKPRDLVSDRAPLQGRRLPVKECVRIGLTLCEALEFLHQQGMTHRDIKPQNIIFVNGQPKLADLGLITEIRPADQERTLVGTPGYMPPSPERPGTVAADIYALGMVLYVLCTGRAPGLFPEVATTLVNTGEPPEFLPLNTVILKACQPFPADRYVSAAQMSSALATVPTTIEKFSRRAS
jgi:CHASE2 domain-containing sensor protein